MAVVPDYSSAGSVGTLPEDFAPWQRGVTCTVRPEWLAPIEPGRIYLANVSVRRWAPPRAPFTGYELLYEHAMAIAGRHALERTAAAPLDTWIQAHAWFQIDLPDSALVSATVTLGISSNDAGASATRGESLPTAEDLRRPGGHTPEALAGKHDARGQRRIDHLYTDFDRTGGTSGDVTLSYGEYAEDAPSDFRPLIGRAERFVQAYDPSLALLMREWRATETNKALDLPWIIVAETYLRRR